MRRLLFLISLMLLFTLSCEKPDTKGEAGNPLIRFYGDAYYDRGLSVVSTSWGYAICGRVTLLTRGVNDLGSTYIQSSDEDMGIIGTGKSGIQRWSLNIGDDRFDEGRKVIIASDGTFIAVGTATSGTGSAIHRDILITKADPSGTLIWERRLGGTGNQEANDIIETSDGSFLIVGSTDVYNLSSGNENGWLDIFYMKISANGDLIYSDSNGYSGNEYGQKVIKAHNGGYLILGTTDYSNPGQTGKNIILSHINDDLSLMDRKVFGAQTDEYGSDIEPVEGGYVVAGTSVESNEKFNGLIFRLVTGNLDQPYEIHNITNGDNPVEINSICPYSDGVFLLSGSTGTRQSGEMLFMFVDEKGVEVSSPRRMVFGGAGYQAVFDALKEDDGKIVAVGVNSYETNSLITLVKFTPEGN